MTRKKRRMPANIASLSDELRAIRGETKGSRQICYSIPLRQVDRLTSKAQTLEKLLTEDLDEVRTLVKTGCDTAAFKLIDEIMERARVPNGHESEGERVTGEAGESSHGVERAAPAAH